MAPSVLDGEAKLRYLMFSTALSDPLQLPKVAAVSVLTVGLNAAWAIWALVYMPSKPPA